MSNFQEITQSSTVSEPVVDEQGVLCHTVNSHYQRSATRLRVLIPDEYHHVRFVRLQKLERKLHRRYPIVYLLGADPDSHRSSFDALNHARQSDLHNQHQVICVEATFSDVPWYANHPTDPTLQQETYFLRSIVPFIEHEFAIDKSQQRLVGFGKSGWGAFSLLLRHPGSFVRAAAWDAPLGAQTPTKFGMTEIFGTQANFERYDIWDLLEARADLLRESQHERLGLFGYSLFRSHHQATHHQMQKLAVPHRYVDGPKREHSWRSGWLEEVFTWFSMGLDNPQL